MDQGGELYQSTAVRSLFKKYGYQVLPTGADSSFQNGPVEQAHCTVATGIKSLLIGSGLDSRFWPYAFTHVLCICNAIPGQGQVASPLFCPLERKIISRICVFLDVEYGFDLQD